MTNTSRPPNSLAYNQITTYLVRKGCDVTTHNGNETTLMAARIIVLDQKIDPVLLRSICDEVFTSFVKFVADIRLGLLAVGGEMHADAEQELLENGSHQSDLWGGNFYPDEAPARRLEFTSFINIRPRDGNSSMEVGDEELQIEITKLCSKLLLDPDDTLA